MKVLAYMATSRWPKNLPKSDATGTLQKISGIFYTTPVLSSTPAGKFADIVWWSEFQIVIVHISRKPSRFRLIRATVGISELSRTSLGSNLTPSPPEAFASTELLNSTLKIP